MDDAFVYIGERENWGGSSTLFGIAPHDWRHHLYVIGQTGSGKTPKLRNPSKARCLDTSGAL